VTRRSVLTFADLLARPAAERADDRARAGDDEASHASAHANAAHGAVRVALGGMLWDAFGRAGRAGTAWWILGSVEVLLGARDLLRPDLVGFRRRRGDDPPAGWPVRERPQWVCAIVSTAGGGEADARATLDLCARHRIAHCWIADVDQLTLAAHRFADGGYLAAAPPARAGEVVRIEPFEQIAITVSDVFGEER
jgi:hypothetical protein